MYLHRHLDMQMTRGNLVGGRQGITQAQPAHNECDVTCSVEGVGGKTQMCNGLFRFNGAPVTGVELDHEAEFGMEYGRPEGDLILINYSGVVFSVRAWISTSDGPQVVLESTFQKSIQIKDGDVIPVVGPQLRYMHDG